MGCSSLAMQKAGKQKHKKGLWSPEEDLRLRNYIHKHGHACWSSVPINAGLQRTGKSCRLRWINYLRPGLKRGMFTAQEDHTIFTLHSMLGNKWSQIARHLPGRTDNEIKNYWHSYLKKKVSKMDENQPRSTLENPSQSTEKTEPSLSSPSQISVVQNQLHEEMQTSSSTKENSNVPKVLFTEWLSLDQFQGQKLTNAGKLEVSKDAIQHDIDTYYSFLDDFLLNEGVFNGSFFAMDDISSQFSMNNDVMYM